MTLLCNVDEGKEEKKKKEKKKKKKGSSRLEQRTVWVTVS